MEGRVQMGWGQRGARPEWSKGGDREGCGQREAEPESKQRFHNNNRSKNAASRRDNKPVFARGFTASSGNMARA